MATAQGSFQEMTTREEFRALAAEHRVVPVAVSYTHLTLPTILLV